VANRKLIHPTSSGADIREYQWWREDWADPKLRAQHVLDTVSQIWRDCDSLRQGQFRWAGLYANDPFLSNQLGFTPKGYKRNQVSARPAPLSLNAVKAVSDTYVAMVTADRPKVSCVTSGGNWDLQQKGILLEKFIEGVLYENDAYRTATQVNYDVVKFGTGIVKICDDRPRETRIRIERILPWEVLVHPDDALYGEPQCMYQVKRFDRLVLQETWPEFAKDLVNGGADFTTSTPGQALFSQGQDDFVVVVEAWRLPQGKDSPGRHTIVCGLVTLLDEEWHRPHFPFEFLYRQQPSEGIWGLSLAQELSGLQLSLNKMLRDIQRAQNLVVGHYMIDNATEINTGSISDRIGGFIRYRGNPPIYNAPPPASDQNIAYLQQTWQRCFETIGVSQQTAQSQKPADLNSGKALQVYADIQSQRFKPSYEEYQHWFLRIARQIIATADNMDEEFYVKAAGSKVMQAVRWADIGLDDSEFSLKLYPTNALADDPASRMQQVQDLMTAGLIDPKAGRRLLDMPDLEEFSSYENASYNLTMKIITQILSGGKYVGPEPFMDLEESVKLVQLAYLKARLEDVSEDRCETLSRWMSQAKGIPGWSGYVPPIPLVGANTPITPQGPAALPMPGMPQTPTTGMNIPPGLPPPPGDAGGPLAPGTPPPPPQNSL
jgi:hypothetical protein